MRSDQLWQGIIGEMELVIGKANFTTWFKDTSIIDYQNGIITVGVPNSFTESWLRKKYHQQLVKTAKTITDGVIKDIAFKVDSQKTQTIFDIGPVGTVYGSTQTTEESAPKVAPKPIENQQKPQTPHPLTATYPTTATTTQPQQQANTVVLPPKPNYAPTHSYPVSSFNLNHKYTFETFIVGKGNELAYAASRAVAEHPGTLYNPLFIYGGVGLGKTHLIQAIGNEIAKHNPNAKILYITTEKFTNDFIQALKTGQMEKFRNNYRSIDVLLVDDIQFMAGKDQTQEEFFHTFNALYQSNKQIVLNSDRPPRAISSIEQRLVSRFGSGMIADISQPDSETRIAILESKVKEKGMTVPEDVLRYIADNINSNIRELEGALNKIIAIHQLINTTPNMETAQRVVQSMAAMIQHGSLTAKQIVNTVAAYYGITVTELVSLSRKKDLVLPRQIAMYIIRQQLNSSFPTIGEELGGRDHTTAMHACNKINEQIQTDQKMKNDIDNIVAQLRQAVNN